MSIRLESDCTFVASTAFLSELPAINGFPLTNNHRLKRALWAYQWALTSRESWTEGGMTTYPSIVDVDAAMHAWETDRG